MRERNSANFTMGSPGRPTQTWSCRFGKPLQQRQLPHPSLNRSYTSQPKRLILTGLCITTIRSAWFVARRNCCGLMSRMHIQTFSCQSVRDKRCVERKAEILCMVLIPLRESIGQFHECSEVSYQLMSTRREISDTTTSTKRSGFTFMGFRQILTAMASLPVAVLSPLAHTAL